jgi:NTE family protein
MDINALTNDSALRSEISRVKEKIQNPEHAISDVLDDAGNQYIDLVMEGGGMLGIALVGYTWALEEMGIRFLGIGGTSAGSINALLLAAMDDPAEKKSPKLLEVMGVQNFYDFVDGDGSPKGRKKTRDLIELALDGEPIRLWKGLKLIYRYLGVRKQLIREYGLNRGDAFQNWLTDLIAAANIRTTAELRARMQRIPELHIREGREMPPDWKPEPGKLVIISSDITTETRVEFPAMADLYWKNVDNLNPAHYARASMSIPYFFETYRVTDLPNTNQAHQRWNKVGLDWAIENSGHVPDHILFVDGGITSNFPIDAFHDNSKVPSRPTFGVKLEHDNRYKPPTKLPLTGDGSRAPLLSLTGAIFNSARHTLDYEFVKKNPDYHHLVQFIPCTYIDPETDRVESYNWLDFNMPTPHREGLFRQGAQRAIEFVEEFSDKWGDYKELRKSLMAR